MDEYYKATLIICIIITPFMCCCISCLCGGCFPFKNQVQKVRERVTQPRIVPEQRIEDPCITEDPIQNDNI